MSNCDYTIKTGDCSCTCAGWDAFEEVLEAISDEIWLEDIEGAKAALGAKELTDGTVAFDLAALFDDGRDDPHPWDAVEDALKLCLPGSRATACTENGDHVGEACWYRYQMEQDGALSWERRLWLPDPFDYVRELAEKASQEGLFVADVCDVVERLSDDPEAVAKNLADKGLAASNVVEQMDALWDNSDLWESMKSCYEEALQELGVEAR